MNFVKEMFCQKELNISLSESNGIICIVTSNPVYLVFGQNPEKPDYVIRKFTSQKSGYEHLERAKKLREVFTANVAEPIAIVENNNFFYYIEKGIAGLPWFQISESHNSIKAWDNLRERAVMSLQYFQKGVSSRKEWLINVNVSKELLESYFNADIEDTELKVKIKNLVDRYCTLLDELGVINNNYQHGDFCLNNLIIDNNSVHFIDFEDFGKTSFPMFDEISLALSLFIQVPNSVVTTLKDEIKYCIKNSLNRGKYSPSLLPAFFLYHLLFRLGKWGKNDNRTEYKQWILDILIAFVSSPYEYFESFYDKDMQ
jgi:hypothetical protein